MNRKNILCRNIKRARENSEMPREILAKKIDVSSGHLKRIEAGQRLPSLHTLYKIADALNVTVKDLMNFD